MSKSGLFAHFGSREELQLAVLEHAAQLYGAKVFVPVLKIERGLCRVEAGAQGGHKLARGYGPVATWSAHFIADPGFRRAVADYLEQERAAEVQEMEWLEGHMPFRRAD